MERHFDVLATWRERAAGDGQRPGPRLRPLPARGAPGGDRGRAARLLQRVAPGASLSIAPEVALGRTAERGLGVLSDHQIEPAAIDPLERDTARAASTIRRTAAGRKWDEIRIAAHEAHEAAVLDHLDDVAAQKRAPAVRRRPPNAAPGHPGNGRRAGPASARPRAPAFPPPRTGSPGPAASPTPGRRHAARSARRRTPGSIRPSRHRNADARPRSRRARPAPRPPAPRPRRSG